MAENDIIFNVGLEVDTSEVKRQLKNLRVPQIKIPTAADFIKSDTELRSFTRGAHKAWVEKESRKLASVVIGSGLTPTQALTATHPLVGLSKSQRIIRGQLGARVSELVTDVKTQQRQAEREQKAQERASLIAQRQADLVQQIESAKDIRTLPPLTRRQIIAEGGRIQNIAESQQNETQKKLLSAANVLVSSLDKRSKDSAQVIAAVGKVTGAIASLRGAFELAKSGINEYSRQAGIGFYQAANPEYKPGYTNWLSKFGLSEQQAERAQYEITTFRRRMQMGQVGAEELRTYGQFAPDVYNALLSNASFEQKVMQIRRALRSTSAEDRAQLLQNSAISNLLVSTLAYSDEDVLGGYETAMATGASQQARVVGALDTRRMLKVGGQIVEKARSDFQNTIGGAKTGAGAGAAIGAALLGTAALVGTLATGGAALPAIVAAGGAATAGGVGGGLIGGGIGLTGGLATDLAQQSGVELFDYNKTVPVRDVSQREITINNTFQLDGENVYNQTTHHLISNAETGVM